MYDDTVQTFEEVEAALPQFNETFRELDQTYHQCFAPVNAVHIEDPPVVQITRDALWELSETSARVKRESRQRAAQARRESQSTADTHTTRTLKVAARVNESWADSIGIAAARTRRMLRRLDSNLSATGPPPS